MNSLKYVGLDVHKETIAVAVAEEGRAAPTSIGTIRNDPAAVRKLIRQLGGRARLRCCYEAGPCGYVLYHQLTDQGVSCQVVAPSLVPRRPGDRVKTDRRDALKLALGLRAGTLTPIWVPDPADEAMRDLVRAREDALEDLLGARHRLGEVPAQMWHISFYDMAPVRQWTTLLPARQPIGTRSGLQPRCWSRIWRVSSINCYGCPGNVPYLSGNHS